MALQSNAPRPQESTEIQLHKHKLGTKMHSNCIKVRLEGHWYFRDNQKSPDSLEEPLLAE